MLAPQITINLNLEQLYNRLDEAGKKVMLDCLTEGISQGFVRDMLIAQWERKEEPSESDRVGIVP